MPFAALCRVQPFHRAAHGLGIAAVVMLTLAFLLPMQPVWQPLPWGDWRVVFFRIPNMARGADLQFGLFLATTLATIAVMVSRRYNLFYVVTAHHVMVLMLIASWQQRSTYRHDGFILDQFFNTAGQGNIWLDNMPLALWFILLVTPVLLVAGLASLRAKPAVVAGELPRCAAGPCGVWLVALGVFMSGFMASQRSAQLAAAVPNHFTAAHYGMLCLALCGGLAVWRRQEKWLIPLGVVALGLTGWAWRDMSILGARPVSGYIVLPGQSPFWYMQNEVGWCGLALGGLLMLCGGAVVVTQNARARDGIDLAYRPLPVRGAVWNPVLLLLPTVSALLFFVYLRWSLPTAPFYLSSIWPDSTDPHLMWTRTYLLPGLALAWWLQYARDPRLRTPAAWYTAGSWAALYLSFWVMEW